MSGVCVIGAGPAGCVLAARLAQLGHDVCLVERARFPRPRLGESLSPGVLPLLETIGAREAIEEAGFRRVASVRMRWEGDTVEREDPRQLGLLVDRGRFDRLLLARARALGVRVVQPAAVRERRPDADGWSLRIQAGDRTVDLRAGFLADAAGRAAALPGHRRHSDSRTIALYAYWRGTDLPRQPRIEAGAAEWFWGVPLPDGTYNTLAFVDAARLRGTPAGALAGRFLELLDRSGLMAGCRDARLASPVRAADATAYLDDASVSPLSIKVGDAALALDPLSSSGVQKAIQTALAGAVVVNTMLRRPVSRDDAMRFYRESLEHASARHRAWAAGHYAAVAAGRGERFWQDRAAGAPAAPAAAAPVAGDQWSGGAIELSPGLEFVDVPCIEGDFVAVKRAVRHPGLDGPLAWVGGWELAPLLGSVRAGMTPLHAAQAWSGQLPLKSGLALAGWLLAHGILVRSEPRAGRLRVR